MQVKEFVPHVKTQVWPECQAQLDSCKTVLDAVMWRRKAIRALQSLRIAGEEHV